MSRLRDLLLAIAVAIGLIVVVIGVWFAGCMLTGKVP